MPYIEQKKREAIRAGEIRPVNAGELNFALSDEIRFYWQNSLRRYQDINDIIGALEGAKAEFQRQVVVKYEDQKISDNGGLY